MNCFGFFIIFLFSFSLLVIHPHHDHAVTTVLTHHSTMAWYSLVVLKVPLHTNQPYCTFVVEPAKVSLVSRQSNWTAVLKSTSRHCRCFYMHWTYRSIGLHCIREFDSFFIAWSSASTLTYYRSFQLRCRVYWRTPTSESSTTSFHSSIKSCKNLRFTKHVLHVRLCDRHCLSVCHLVGKITAKVISQFHWNLMVWLGLPVRRCS